MDIPMDDAALESLRTFFASTPLPDKVELYPGTTIVDMPLFVRSHLSVAALSNRIIVRKAAFDRPVRLREVLEGKY